MIFVSEPNTEIGKGRRTFILVTTQDLGNNCFSANVPQCNIAFSVAQLQVCFKSFLLMAWVAAKSIKRICASWKTTTAHTIQY